MGHEPDHPSPMRDGLSALTEREKETLRLLLGGHDAKSTARSLGLSVHTVNERLRDARRKLGVSSSREAARMLGDAERGGPESPGDKGLGVLPDAAAMRMDRRRSGAQRLVWFSGGMLVMSLIIAAVMFSSPVLSGGSEISPPVEGAATAETAGTASARRWVALLDSRRWEDSWRRTAAVFRAQMPAARWASTIESVRGPLGAVTGRSVQSITRTKSLPGVPAGDYQVIEFRTGFANKSGAVETVVLAREGGAWRVAGYFIR